MIRIVGGKYRSRQLHLPPLDTVRPTQDRIREAVFSALGGYLSGTGLDLFAGSGAYGFEGLSRGLSSVVFVDKDHRCIQAINESANALNCSSLTRLLNLDYQVALDKLEKENAVFDYVFLDPPYAKEINKDIIIRVEAHLLKANGIVIAEQEEDLAEIPGFNLKRYQYSYKKVGIYRKEEGK
ncbi:MAG: 16S rRNA (guanine(966)-N(2))-methyltransferase RsmD [Bacilli bacterium]|jgi:16S rRNA (guanine966-N2)-methyltransferase|nr:16S rRNA (guanine(966)-N(2))-methyltransferase RsmD [Bacilli bacterium]